MVEGKKILVADDDAGFREYVRAMLEQGGYSVIEAEDGMKAILRIMNESPDLILLDLAMPTISGFRVSELMLSVPETRSIPFIVISGDASLEQGRVKAMGAQALFPKPFIPEELLRQIEAVLATPILEIIEEATPEQSPMPETPPPAEAPAEPDPPNSPAGDAGGIGPRTVTEPAAVGLLRRGETAEAALVLRKDLDGRPDDLALAGYLKLAESMLVSAFFGRVGDPKLVVPRLEPSLAGEITRFSLNPAEGFLLSQIDGRTDLENLFFVSGMDRFRTCLLLDKLHGEGIVLLSNKESRQ